ncbi:MAG TPA: SCO family protein [Candidatus Sulfotelmatobacter sp.]|nr:SCO family protein [Candidatus Sulfotelmatobacter sp.]
MPSLRSLRFVALAAIVIVVALAGFGVARLTGLIGPNTSIQSLALPTIGGPFSLVDQNDKPVTDAAFRGKVMLVYFGYTFCPDVCPTELAKIGAALDALGPKANQVAPLFITVDPERDTPAKLKPYVEQFSPRLIGLTGTPEQVKAVEKEYRVYAAKSGDTSGQYYLMDHTSFIYLMDQEGHYRAVSRPDISPQALADKIRELLRS